MDDARARSRRTELSRDRATGRWCAKLGKKKTCNGKPDGHKFRFSTDQRESERRKLRIQDLWDSLIAVHGPGYFWDSEALTVAMALAAGESQVAFAMEEITPWEDIRRRPYPYNIQACSYAERLAQIQQRFPNIAVVPIPEDQPHVEKGKRLIEQHGQKEIHSGRRHLLGIATIDSTATNGPTVAQALDAYEAHIKTSMLVIPDPEEGIEGRRLSDTGQSYLKQIAQIRVHNAEQLDWPLSRLTFEGCDAMLEVWRKRPRRKDGQGSLLPKTCKEHAKLLKRFFKWLSKSDRFDWKKPSDFDELGIKIHRPNREKAAPVTSLAQQVRTFTVDELGILNQYAIPFERFLLLCGLNLGFKRMECATLRVGEIQLQHLHEFANYIDFEFTADLSFVRRLRTKTEVYGEWLLWPLTVTAMEWVITRRKGQTKITMGDGNGRPIPFSADALVLLSDAGHSFTKPTKNGNPNHQLTNMWNRLLRRIHRDHTDFPPLPHETLRDTAANWIREEFGGEIADIFLSHGAPLGARSLVECYTNKPFGKVFRALRWLEAKLQPMFEATPATPFPSERKLGGGGLTLKQQQAIHRLDQQGISAAEIAREVGCATATVYRHWGRGGNHAMLPNSLADKRKKVGPNVTPSQIRQIRSLRKQGFKVKKIAELVGLTTSTVHRHLEKK